jgi:hypothetical protein
MMQGIFNVAWNWSPIGWAKHALKYSAFVRTLLVGETKVEVFRWMQDFGSYNSVPAAFVCYATFLKWC